MEIIGFAIEERESKTGKKYRVLVGLTKNGEKYFLSFVNKLK